MRGWLLWAVLVSFAAAPAVFAQRDPADKAESAAYAAAHDAALRRARVWSEPDTPIERAKLGDNPEGPEALAPNKAVSCFFRPGGVSGSTPKFDCELESGVKVKVKYGRENAEVYADVIASRLLGALGFPADRMYVVDRVRCYGCPADPFAGLQCVNDGGAIEGCFPNLDETKYVEFDTAVIERPLKGRRVETRKERGWTWEELGKIDPAAGGAPRAHVDALRLLAIFLNHWDNKAKNQRLLCLGEEIDPIGCSSRRPARNPSP